MENKKTLSSKLIIACIIPPAIVAAFACTAFSLVTTNIIHKHVVKTTESVIYYLQGNIQSIIQPNVEKMSNWQSILKEIRDKEPLTLVMKGISADLAEDTLFYFATATSRFERDGFFIQTKDRGISPPRKTADASPSPSLTSILERANFAPPFHSRFLTKTAKLSVWRLWT